MLSANKAEQLETAAPHQARTGCKVPEGISLSVAGTRRNLPDNDIYIYIYIIFVDSCERMNLSLGRPPSLAAFEGKRIYTYIHIAFQVK